MADTKQTLKSQYDIHPPEGIVLPHGAAERWQDLFQQAGLSPDQAKDVQGWYWLLTEDPKAHQIEREVLRPQEVAALGQHQQALMEKRHASGLSPSELGSWGATEQETGVSQRSPSQNSYFLRKKATYDQPFPAKA